MAMTEKKFLNEDWKQRLEAIRLNINVPLDVEPVIVTNNDKLSLQDLKMEQQNGILWANRKVLTFGATLYRPKKKNPQIYPFIRAPFP